MSFKVIIKYAGVELTTLPENWSQLFPGRRTNFFEVPWTASTYGRGKALVTSTQLEKIRGVVLAVTEENGNGEGGEPIPQAGHDLELLLYNLADELQGDRSVTLHDIYIVSDHPVIVGTDFIEDDNAWTTKGGALEGVQEGLWEIELADERAILMNKEINKWFNVREPTGTCYLPVSLRDGDPRERWEYDEVIDFIFNVTLVQSDTFSVTGEGKPEDLVFRNCPGPIALDRVLNELGKVAVYDSTKDVGERWSVVPFEDRSALDSARRSVGSFHVRGGEGLVYPAVMSSEKYRIQAPTEWTPSTSPAIPELLTDTIVGTNSAITMESGVNTSERAVSGSTRTVHTMKRAQRNTKLPPAAGDWRSQVATPAVDRGERMALIDSVYTNFLSQFLGIGGLTMVTFSWTPVPLTHIERRSIRPMGQLIKNRVASELRGEPAFVGLGQGLGMDVSMDETGWLQFNAVPMWFLGEVTHVHNTGTGIAGSDRCTVKATHGDPATLTKVGESVENVWCFPWSWIEIDDPVLVLYIGHAECSFLAMSMPPVITEKYCRPAPEACIYMGESGCNPCVTPLKKEDENPYSTPTPCDGKPIE